ncbi:histocompatibility antigen 60b-like, partial [Mus caroli]|uniref:Histocompatibility antigen 60b-like n=1 Tax=Mus caroli TaxID=10089 RepID=A0A6P5P9G5_MUSCR
MAKGATSKSNHCLNLSLFILLSYLGTTLPDGTDSLSCELTFNYRTLHGQCSVNGKTLHDFGDKTHEGNATKMCADLTQNLTEISEVMRDLQSGKDALNVTTKAQYNQGEFIDGFWAINTEEQHSIYFYPLNMTWRESHSDNSSAMEQWKNKNLEKAIRNVLMVDFSSCLKKLLPRFREMPKSTIKVPDTIQCTNATQIHPTVNNPQHNSDTHGLCVTWIVIICIGGLMLFMIFAWCMLKKKKGAPCCSSSSAVLITSYNQVTLQHIPVASPAEETLEEKLLSTSQMMEAWLVKFLREAKTLLNHLGKESVVSDHLEPKNQKSRANFCFAWTVSAVPGAEASA